MNIGFFTNTYLPAVSGVTTVIENYREELEKQGHNVYIFAAKHILCL
jgi:1,2-diacylglycerol 3-alpha-glucosyltransferase